MKYLLAAILVMSCGCANLHEVRHFNGATTIGWNLTPAPTPEKEGFWKMWMTVLSSAVAVVAIDYLEDGDIDGFGIFEDDDKSSRLTATKNSSIDLSGLTAEQLRELSITASDGSSVTISDDDGEEATVPVSDLPGMFPGYFN